MTQKKISSVFNNVLILLLTMFLLLGCSDSEKQIKITGSTMGTQYHITLVTQKKSPTLSGKILKQKIDTLLMAINQQMSTYIDNSEISLFNRSNKTDWFLVSKDFAYVVSSALKVSQQSDGAFDITVSPFIELWGFGSKTQYTPPTKSQITDLLPHVGFQLLNLQDKPTTALSKDDERLHIDLSAIAKGFAVDKISLFLNKAGFKNYLVEIGGEVRASGNNKAGEKWRIAIEQPDKKEKQINKIITLRDKALATSGDYRNYYIKDGIRYSHTINPKTGIPTKHQLASVTVMHNSTMYADAYATALMVMGEKVGRRFAKQHNLSVNMIIRKKDGRFSTWSHLFDEIIQ